MASRIAHIWEKIVRANHQIGTLNALLRGLDTGQTYRAELDPNTWDQVPAVYEYTPDQVKHFGFDKFPGTYRALPNGNFLCWRVKAESARLLVYAHDVLPLGYWAAIAGEIINSLRSALDNLVWELTVHHRGQPSDPLPAYDTPEGRLWRSIYFPVVGKQHNWDSLGKGYGPRELWGIHPAIRARFKRSQPFLVGKDYERHWLYALHQLWIADKHRTPAVVVSTVAFKGFEPLPGQVVPHFIWGLLDDPLIGPFKEGAELARIRIVRTDPEEWPLDGKMDMNFRFDFDIAFDEGPPAYGAWVRRTLQAVCDEVTAIIIEFEPEFSF